MHIFYPTDFSETSLHAFIYALQLAKSTGGAVTTFHAYHMPDIKGANLPNTLREVYESVSLEEFEDYRDSIPLLRKMAEEHEAGDVRMSHVLHQGEPKRSILNAIAAEKPDIVVMGTNGTGKLSRMFVGSVAAAVMEESPVPVLVVPADAVYRYPVRKIAYATDLQHEDDKVIGQALNVAQIFGAQLIAVHADVSHVADSSGRTEAFRAAHPDLPLSVLESTDIESSVKRFVAKHDIDIVATIIHERNRIQEMFAYSLTKRFARELNVPVLAFHVN